MCIIENTTIYHQKKIFSIGIDDNRDVQGNPTLPYPAGQGRVRVSTKQGRVGSGYAFSGVEYTMMEVKIQ